MKMTEHRSPRCCCRSRKAAQALSLCERTIWDLVKKGELPHVKVGRRIFFSPASLQSWIERQESTTDPKSISIA